jgi:hypothetical protein
LERRRARAEREALGVARGDWEGEEGAQRMGQLIKGKKWKMKRAGARGRQSHGRGEATVVLPWEIRACRTNRILETRRHVQVKSATHGSGREDVARTS